MLATVRKLGSRAAAALGQLAALAGMVPSDPVDFPFGDADVARLFTMTGAEGNGAAIDAATWDGMLMPAYFSSLTNSVGICGRQQLYAWLRGGQDDAGRTALQARLAVLEQADPQLTAVCLPLRAVETDVVALLFGADAAIPAWAGKCWLLTAGLVASVAAVAYSPVAWLPALFFLFQMMAVQLRHHAAVEEGTRVREGLHQMLRCCSLAAASSHPALREFAEVGERAGRINRALSPSPARRAPGLGVYLDWFMQANVEHHFRSLRRIGAERDFLQQCYRLCARFEADLALARHRAAATTCWAQAGAHVHLALARHPLLASPMPLSVEMGADGLGLFISGQNGIGKSTLLRSVGLNLLTARAFGLCYAASATVPMLPVVASMQSEDSLLDGASLYVAELTRARSLLDASANGQRAIFIIDEIFRGTNHLESVAAAAAVLDELAAASLVMVSSHNVVLARLLAHRLAPLCVSRNGAGALQVAPGVLADVNGVTLLGRHGFGAAIESKARRVAHWLGACMAEPPGAAGVLVQPDPIPIKAA